METPPCCPLFPVYTAQWDHTAPSVAALVFSSNQHTHTHFHLSIFFSSISPTQWSTALFAWCVGTIYCWSAEKTKDSSLCLCVSFVPVCKNRLHASGTFTVALLHLRYKFTQFNQIYNKQIMTFYECILPVSPLAFKLVCLVEWFDEWVMCCLIFCGKVGEREGARESGNGCYW